MKIRNTHITVSRLVYEILDHFIEVFMVAFAYITLPIIKLHRSESGKKKVLLVCHRAYMTEYFCIVTDILKDDPRITICILDYHLYDVPQSRLLIRKALPYKFVSRFTAYLTKWDLIVSSGTVQKHLVTNQRSPTLLIEHGIAAAGGIRDNKYSFLAPDIYYNGKNGKVRFDNIFVSSQYSKERAVKIDEQLEPVISIVGFYPIDRLLALLPQRAQIRNSLGVGSNDKVVMTLSTWGDNCLFNLMGDALIEQAKQCMDQYKFILNIHPLECRKKPKGIRVWGDHFLELKKDGFIVRTPQESLNPYLIAADVIVTDYTSLSLHIPCLNIPVIVIPYDESFVAKDGLVRELKDLSPRLEIDAENLRQVINGVLEHYPYDKLKDIAQLVNSYPGLSIERQKEEIYSMLKIRDVMQ